MRDLDRYHFDEALHRIVDCHLGIYLHVGQAVQAGRAATAQLNAGWVKRGAVQRVFRQLWQPLLPIYAPIEADD